MQLNLRRPFAVIDVETTGVHPQVDRVIQIGVVKVYPDGKTTEWQTLINPGIGIPEEATAVHGISDGDVALAPPFKEIAPKLAAGFKDTDIGGFNVRFDVMFLRKEFERVNARDVLADIHIVDAFRIFTQKRPRNLTAAVKEYLNEELEGAHDALTDARAALRVLEAQLAAHEDLPRNVEELHKIFFETPAEGHLDADGKLAWRHGQATINFGKYATQPLRTVTRSYLQWIMDGDFSPEVKRIVSECLKGNFPRRER